MLSVLSHRRVVVALLFLLLGIIGLGVLPEAERERSSLDSLAAGTQSAEVAEIEERLPSKDTSSAIVLFSSDDRLSEQQLGELRSKVKSWKGAGPVVPAQDGTAVTVPVTIEAVDAEEVETLVQRLRTTARSDLPDGVTAQVTGPATIQADLAEVFKGANLKLLAVTALVVAILLVITYRSPFLWLVPLVVIGVADRLAAVLAAQALHLMGVAWDESTTGILSVLVFGAGTDYALLLISRYRDELRRHDDRFEAMALTVRRTREAVLASSLTVFVGLATLALSLFPTTRGLGLACALGVLVAAFFALVVLPGILVMFGRWIFWPRIPRRGEALDESRSVWHRLGVAVERRPVTVAVVSIAMLAVTAGGLLVTKTGLADSDQFLDTPESISAAQRLGESFPAGSSSPMTLIAPSADADRVMSLARGTEGVAQVSRTNEGAGYTQLQVITSTKPGTEASENVVHELRDAIAPVDGAALGGGDADRVDEADGTTRDRWVILPLVLALVTLALVLLLRSVVAPLVLVATVLLTYVASLGLSWWLFTGILGFDRLDAGAPLKVFVFLVALGVDYNIFLVTRAREEAATHCSRAGMLRALTATGGVITSAGILLAAVFAVLGVLPLVVLAQIGVIICVGVLLDTLVVRTVLDPAIALILGDRFWWPRSVTATGSDVNDSNNGDAKNEDDDVDSPHAGTNPGGATAV